MIASASLVVLQRINTIWTKASRGRAGAAARNATPDAIVLPPATYLDPADGFFLHEVVYSEHNRFQRPLEKFERRQRTDPIWYDCLQISVENQTLIVTLVWEQGRGAPRRNAFPRTVWSFQPGQWGRLTYNFRHVGHHGWIYEKYVISIGMFRSHSSDLFLNNKPMYSYSDLVKLW